MERHEQKFVQDAGHIGQGESFGRQAFFGENAIKTRGGRVTALADLKPPKRLRLGFVGFGFGCAGFLHIVRAHSKFFADPSCT